MTINYGVMSLCVMDIVLLYIVLLLLIFLCVWYIVLLHSTIAVDVLKYWAKILLPFIPGSQVAVG